MLDKLRWSFLYISKQYYLKLDIVHMFECYYRKLFHFDYNWFHLRKLLFLYFRFCHFHSSYKYSCSYLRFDCLHDSHFLCTAYKYSTWCYMTYPVDKRCIVRLYSYTYQVDTLRIFCCRFEYYMHYYSTQQWILFGILYISIHHYSKSYLHDCNKAVLRNTLHCHN